MTFISILFASLLCRTAKNEDKIEDDSKICLTWKVRHLSKFIFKIQKTKFSNISKRVTAE